MRRETQYPYEWLHKYPGMRPKDVAIWDAFLVQHPDAFFRVWYDVHLGDPVQVEADREEQLKSGMYDVARWCVDVLADDGTGFWAIEIKPNAGAGALGQALGYAALLNKEHVFDRPVRPAVLTDNVAPITQQAAELLKVVVFTP
jgi:hypothetical protein